MPKKSKSFQYLKKNKSSNDKVSMSDARYANNLSYNECLGDMYKMGKIDYKTFRHMRKRTPKKRL